ncbi:hypothetical protein VSK91_05750 [Bacillus swezeyi]
MAVETVDFDFADLAVPADLVDLMIVEPVEIENQIAESAALIDLFLDSFENLVELGHFVVEMRLIGIHFVLIEQAAAEDFQVLGQAQYL